LASLKIRATQDGIPHADGIVVVDMMCVGYLISKGAKDQRK